MPVAPLFENWVALGDTDGRLFSSDSVSTAPSSLNSCWPTVWTGLTAVVFGRGMREPVTTTSFTVVLDWSDSCARAETPAPKTAPIMTVDASSRMRVDGITIPAILQSCAARGRFDPASKPKKSAAFQVRE